MSPSKEEEAAHQAIREAKSLIRDGKYKDAKAKIQGAINLFPRINYGREYITLCEILQLCDETPGYFRSETWPYTLFQIPSSSTEIEVKIRCDTLKVCLITVYYQQISGAVDKAIKELDLAMSMYNSGNRKRKAPSPPPDDDDDDDEYTYDEDENKEATDKEDAASDDDDDDDEGGGGGDTDGDDADDVAYDVRSTGYKKLRKHIYTTLQQKPHFNPLAKYCHSIRKRMKSEIEMIFINLTQKLQNLGGGQILSNKQEDTIRGELSDLEEMGYDVMKLRERFDLLVRVKTISKNDESYDEKIKKLDGKIREETLQLANVQSRVLKLKREKQDLEAQHYGFNAEMASLKSKLSKGDLCNMVQMEEVEDNC